MTREDIIRMAREAGFPEAILELSPTALERFAALVASAEREAWEHRYARLQSLMDIRETQPNKPCCLAEREACAKVADTISDKYGWGHYGNEVDTADEIAKAIRERGKA